MLHIPTVRQTYIFMYTLMKMFRSVIYRQNQAVRRHCCSIQLRPLAVERLLIEHSTLGSTERLHQSSKFAAVVAVVAVVVVAAAVGDPLATESTEVELAALLESKTERERNRYRKAMNRMRVPFVLILTIAPTVERSNCCLAEVAAEVAAVPLPSVD